MEVKKEDLKKIENLLSEIEFGSLNISIQNGKIVHMEQMKKFRPNEIGDNEEKGKTK